MRITTLAAVVAMLATALAAGAPAGVSAEEANGSPAERQRSADLYLAGRLADNPTWQDTYGEKHNVHTFTVIAGSHRAWYQGFLDDNYYYNLSNRLGVEQGKTYFYFPARPFPANLVDARLTETLAGYDQPPPEFDRFGRPRVIYSYQTSAPVLENHIFAVGPEAVRLAGELFP